MTKKIEGHYNYIKSFTRMITKNYSVYIFCVGTFLIKATSPKDAITLLRNFKDLDPTTLQDVPDSDFRVIEVPDVPIYQVG